MTAGPSNVFFSLGDWVMRYYAPAKKCKLDSAWIGPYLVVSFLGWTLGIQKWRKIMFTVFSGTIECLSIVNSPGFTK